MSSGAGQHDTSLPDSRSFNLHWGSRDDDSSEALNLPDSDDAVAMVTVRHRCHESMYLLPRSVGNVVCRDMVVVEADRGQDIGEVIDMEVIPASGSPPQDWRRVLRHATPGEVRQWLTVTLEREQECLNWLRQLSPAEAPGCELSRIQFIDCEFQADCQKLYVYYTHSGDAVIILPLAQMLFRRFRCRIWLHEVRSANRPWMPPAPRTATNSRTGPPKPVPPIPVALSDVAAVTRRSERKMRTVGKRRNQRRGTK